MKLKWLSALLIVPLLMPASPAAANEFPLPPEGCVRDIGILPELMQEGTVAPYEGRYTLFAFTVIAEGCVLAGATVFYRTVHLTTDDNDLDFESGVLTWNPGDMSSRTIYVRVVKDSFVEPNEHFVVKTICPGSTGVSGPTYARGIVLNDDGETPTSEWVNYNYHCRQ